jgi:two-component system LytT family response regulator
MKAILIDDEIKALMGLENKLKKEFPFIDVIYATQKPKEGIEKIKELNPDLVFLDIDMPQISGFDVLLEVESIDFELIFVTAHNQHAIEAIKHCAIGYIVKPIDIDELAIAIKNAQVNIEQKSSLERSRQLLQQISKGSNTIVIPTQKGLSFFKPEDIVRLEGIDGYTNIFLVDDKPIMSSYCIGKFEKMLANRGFFQVHKSHLVNIGFLKSYNNEGVIELKNGDSVPLSRTRKKEFLEQL